MRRRCRRSPIRRRPTRLARKANDYLAEQVRKRPDRFQGLAALPMQDPDLAARELQRCVRGPRLQGRAGQRLLAGRRPDTTVYYDLAQYWPFWAVVEQLDVPFYLHPRNPLPRDARIYEGHPWLMGPIWAFGQETAVHALRLMGSGLFDKHPRLADHPRAHGRGPAVSACGGSTTATPGSRTATTIRRKKKIADYFCANFHLTTSGNFRDQALINAMLEIGADRIMFSTDWPFENIDHAAVWFDAASHQRERPGQDRPHQRARGCSSWGWRSDGAAIVPRRRERRARNPILAKLW